MTDTYVGDWSVPVIQLTPALKQEMRRHHLHYHLWRGFIVIDRAWTGSTAREHIAAVVATTRSKDLKFLLPYDYNHAIREMQVDSILEGRSLADELEVIAKENGRDVRRFT